MSVLSTYKKTGPTAATNFVLCELLIVGGGGSSSTPDVNSTTGGGGGGQVKFFYNIEVPKGVSQTITVGAGGNSSNFGAITAGAGYNGASSSAAAGGSGGIKTDRGGGGGGSLYPSNNKRAEGKGGGATYIEELTNVQSLDSVYSRFVSGGYDGVAAVVNGYSGAGGGAGENAIDTGNTPTGGAGYISGITNTITEYGKGGSGLKSTSSNDASPGAINTGNGASGAGYSGLGASGGSGIVIVAYPNTYAAPTLITGTYTSPTRSGFRVYSFTGSGSITL